MFTVETLTVFK